MSKTQIRVDYSRIRELWKACDEKKWISAKRHYWDIKSAKRNKCLECKLSSPEYIHERIKTDLGDFLISEFIPWKYTGCYPSIRQSKIMAWSEDKKRYISEGILSCYGELVKIKDENMTEDIFSKGLTTIRNLLKGSWIGVAGVSGLLALLVPEKFGTVDCFVLGALVELGEILKNNTCSDITIKEAARMEMVMLKKARMLNETFLSDAWRSRDIDMVLWSHGR